MPRLKVAHLREQGQDMIIIPLDPSFGDKMEQDKVAIVEDLQLHANAAGLRGTVVPVWDSDGGRMAFIAPRPWHPFFSGLNLFVVHRNLNREISW